MIDHVNYICKCAYLQIRVIGHLRPYINDKAAQTLVQNLIITRIDDCNALLYGAPRYVIQKLQRLQNMAARIITRIKRTAHITPSLASLHWLPIDQRIEHKLLVNTYRAIHGTAPEYVLASNHT